MLQKLDSYTKLIANLADKPNLSASDLKAYFDNSPEEIRVAFNNLIDALKAITDGDSGADNIGATAITGLSGTTVQALLEALKGLEDSNYQNLQGQLQNITLGQIPDGSITPTKLSTDAKKAVNITVDDTAGHFTATEVEDVLAELFQFANDGKTNIATVVGSPATTSDTFSELQTHIQDAKNSMATNLTNKGQTSDGTEALQTLADKIANVSTGKKWAKGTATATTKSFYYYYDHSSVTYSGITVTGLDFTPSQVYTVSLADGRGYSAVNTNTTNTYSGKKTILFQSSNNPWIELDGTRAYLTQGGFQVPSTSGSVEWFAFE